MANCHSQIHFTQVEAAHLSMYNMHCIEDCVKMLACFYPKPEKIKGNSHLFPWTTDKVPNDIYL